MVDWASTSQHQGLVQSQDCKTPDKICKVQCLCRKGFPCSVKVHVGFCSSAALTRAQCRPQEYTRNQPQRSSPTRSRRPQHRGEEGNHLQGCLQKSRLSARETPAWGSLITWIPLWVGRGSVQGQERKCNRVHWWNSAQQELISVIGRGKLEAWGKQNVEQFVSSSKFLSQSWKHLKLQHLDSSAPAWMETWVYTDCPASLMI